MTKNHSGVFCKDCKLEIEDIASPCTKTNHSSREDCGKIFGGLCILKILLFKRTQIEPFKIYHHPEDVTICNNGRVMINEIGNDDSSFEFVYFQTELIECDDSIYVELCLSIFVEEENSKK